MQRDYPHLAAELGAKCPPRCIAGRWLSVSAYEANILSAGADAATCCEVWTAILGEGLLRKMTTKKAAKAASAAAATTSVVEVADEPRVEDMKEYSAKMGRWSGEVTAAVADHDLWVLVDALHDARRPLDHLMRFLDTAGDKTVVGGHIYRLAVGDGYRIYAEFNDALAGELAKPVAASEGNFARFKTFAILFHAASFYRRIMAQLSQPPFVFFLLARSPTNVACRIRQRVHLSWSLFDRPHVASVGLPDGPTVAHTTTARGVCVCVR